MTPPKYNSIKLKTGKFRKITKKLKEQIEGEIKALLHASRDTARNRNIDTTKIAFNSSCRYHGEAFGIMRALAIQNYGYFGSVNVSGLEFGDVPEHNLKYWFNILEEEVLEEEGFGTDNRCKYCYEKYGKDAASCVR